MLLGLFSGELIFGGTYYWKEFCISKWAGLDNKNRIKHYENSLKQSTGLYSGGLIIRRIFASEIWGPYFREGFFLWGLIIGILWYHFNNPCLCTNNRANQYFLSAGGFSQFLLICLDQTTTNGMPKKPLACVITVLCSHGNTRPVFSVLLEFATSTSLQNTEVRFILKFPQVTLDWPLFLVTHFMLSGG